MITQACEKFDRYYDQGWCAYCGYTEVDHATAPDSDDISPRASLLREAESLITGDRNKSYGPPTENFQNTADIWNVQFKHLLQPGRFFTAANVAQAMISLKLARMVAQPKRDSYVDIAGYAACGWEAEGRE